MEIVLIFSFFVLFLLSGACLFYSFYSFTKKRRKHAIWSLTVAFLLVLIYVIWVFFLDFDYKMG